MIKFLIDNALSPFVSDFMKQKGYDSVHVRDYNMQSASDEEIFKRASEENRIIVSADTDFSQILSKTNTRKPSVILFRKRTERIPKDLSLLLFNNFSDELINELETGCVVVFEPNRIRIRKLPLMS